LVGKTIREVDPRTSYGANLLAIERKGRLSSTLVRPLPDTELRSGDILFIDLFNADLDLAAIRAQLALEELPVSGAYFADLAQEVGMAECVLPSTSRLVGQTALESKFRANTGLTVVGIRRGRAPLEGNPLNEVVRIGDTLLVVGGWSDIRQLQQAKEDVVVFNLPAEFDQVLPATSRAPQAVACLLLVVGLMVSGLVANVHAALIGCLLMGASGCTDLNSAYRSIHWQSLVLIVGMLPFSPALQRTGGVDLAADALLAMIGGRGDPRRDGEPVRSDRIARPVHLQHGDRGADGARGAGDRSGPTRLALPVRDDRRAGRSSAFMTPVSSPVNTLVVTPGIMGSPISSASACRSR